MGSWGRVKLQRGDSRKIPSKQSHRFPVGEVEAEPAGAQLARGGREGNGTGRGPRASPDIGGWGARGEHGAPLSRDVAATFPSSPAPSHSRDRDGDRDGDAPLHSRQGGRQEGSGEGTGWGPSCPRPWAGDAAVPAP